MQRFQDVQNAWQNGDFDARIEGGESANEMAQEQEIVSIT
jgi:hypothetical protein